MKKEEEGVEEGEEGERNKESVHTYIRMQY
jgi:hypothetical protein